MSCNPQPITLFSELKQGFISYPVLNRFKPDKHTFLKIDWSSEGMVYILIQPATDEEYQHASIVLKDTGTFF